MIDPFELLSIEDAIIDLRLDESGSAAVGGPDYKWLTRWIPAASAAVATWLKDEWRCFVLERNSDGSLLLDSNDDPVPAVDSGGRIVHPSVSAAVSIEIASQYRYREGEGENVVPAEAGHGYVLSKGATALLAPLRRSTVR